MALAICNDDSLLDIYTMLKKADRLANKYQVVEFEVKQ